MRKDKTASTLFYVAATLFFLSAIIIFAGGSHNSTAVIWLCLGSSYSKKSKENKEKEEK